MANSFYSALAHRSINFQKVKNFTHCAIVESNQRQQQHWNPKSGEKIPIANVSFAQYTTKRHRQRRNAKAMRTMPIEQIYTIGNKTILNPYCSQKPRGKETGKVLVNALKSFMDINKKEFFFYTSIVFCSSSSFIFMCYFRGTRIRIAPCSDIQYGTRIRILSLWCLALKKR